MHTDGKNTGTAIVYCSIDFTTTYRHDDRLETVFGSDKQSISFGELLSKIAKVGIAPNELSRLIGKTANKIRQEWLELNNSDSDYKYLDVEFRDFDVENALVCSDYISLTVKLYYKFDMSRLYSLEFEDFDDWDKYTDGFSDSTRDAIDGACIEDSYNDYDFTTNVEDVDFDYDYSFPEPPVYDEYDSVLYNEWYG